MTLITYKKDNRNHSVVYHTLERFKNEVAIYRETKDGQRFIGFKRLVNKGKKTVEEIDEYPLVAVGFDKDDECLSHMIKIGMVKKEQVR